MQPKVKFMGVYSTKHRSSALKVTKEFFFVWQVKDGEETHIHVQEIDGNYVPKGKVFAIDETTLSYFSFEPSILTVPLTKAEEVVRILRPKKAKEPAESPAQAAQSAAAMVETAMRGEFEQALRHLEDPVGRVRALRTIKAMVTRGDLKPVHKHMMRDFAIALRKRQLAEVSLVFAEKTVALAPKDDHAYFNLARIYDILGQFRKAREQLKKAMDLPHDAKDELLYRKLLQHIDAEERLSGGFSRR